MRRFILLFVLSLSFVAYGNGVVAYGNGDYMNEPSYEGVLGNELVEAIEDGDLNEVKALIKKGADVNSELIWNEESGETPLMVASTYGLIDIVRVLLENGADVDTITWYGDSTALNYAAANGHTGVVSLLIEHGATDPSLVDAVKSGDIEKVHTLIKNGADINSKVYNATALLWASSEGHLEILNLLIKEGADIDTGDRVNQTPLMLAAENGHIDIVKLLIKNDADVNAYCGYTGMSVLDYASGNTKILEILKNMGAKQQ